jgi:hypothetical protein
VALVAVVVRSQPERKLSGEFLIAAGCAWAARRDLRLNQGLALEVGFTLHMLGDSTDLAASVYDKLGVAYTIETGATGRRYLVPTCVEPEPAETVQEVEEKRMVALKGARRTKLDVRLSADERASLERAAKAKGVTASALLRELGLSTLMLPPLDPIEEEKRWGGKPPQMRRSAHRYGGNTKAPSPADA